MRASGNLRHDVPGMVQGWIMVLGGLGIGLALWLAPAAGASSRDAESLAKHDFDRLVRAVASRYEMHPKTVPMMWVVNLCAKKFTHGGVRAMKVVEFEDAGRIAGDGAAAGAFSDLVKTQLGARWSPMVLSHESKEDSFVYVQSSGQGAETLTRLIVVDLDGGELSMVSISLNPDQLAKWMDEQNLPPGRREASGAGRAD